MMANKLEFGSADTDDAVDIELQICLNPITPKSFFLYAGAGSGKTRSLKKALENFEDQYGEKFRCLGKKVAVITYTNAAADEIASRVGQNPLFPISTIHSFSWSQICSYQSDIQTWLIESLPYELAELKEKQAKGRSGTQAALDRERGIAAIIKRQEWLSVPRKFIYNPNGNNFDADSLSHAEVLKIFASFIISKPLMQAIIINKYPFLLIDESQDTSKVVMDAFFILADKNKGKFAIGLFGDTMQRIYADGKPDLGENIPSDWAKPIKKMNHRSSHRVIQLGNSLRSVVDQKIQLARRDKESGTVRLYIASSEVENKTEIEQRVRLQMAEICGDEAWAGKDEDIKVLTLEHHMAASRGGFLPMFQALDANSHLKTGLRNGNLSGLRFFSEYVAPLLKACSINDGFGVMAHLRKNSSLLQRKAFIDGANTEDPLLSIRQAVKALVELNADNSDISFLDVLKCVDSHKLFKIPISLQAFLETDQENDSNQQASFNDGLIDEEFTEDEGEISSSSLEAWRNFLNTPYNQIIPFSEYINENSQYGTHQGVKGREFERVLVILDDNEAKGFLFSYEKLFGVESESDGDQKKRAAGEETGIDRTRRLLYVTCTRAEKSLALIVYTKNPDNLMTSVIERGWFDKNEIEILK